MSEHEVTKKLDCMGLMCPMPVVKTKKALKDLEIGEILEMVASDPGSMPDMAAWARQTKHELVEAKELGKNEYLFLIRKTH